MAKQIQLRRGTTAEHSTFTGAAGEVTVDTSKDTVVVHDGSTAGGHPLVKDSEVVHKVASTDNAVPRFNGTTGEVQNSGVFVDDGSNVGIGTISPDRPLHIKTTSVNSAIKLERNGNGSATMMVGGVDDDLRFFTNDSTSESVRFLSSGGITFNGDTSSANAFDDYEEGTWTPSFSSGATNSNLPCHYVKIGQLVTLTMYIYNISGGLSTDDITITNLPFVVNGYGAAPVVHRYCYGSFDQIQGLPVHSTNNLKYRTLNIGGNYGYLKYGDINTSAELMVTVSYRTN